MSKSKKIRKIRDAWASKTEFLLACVGFAVGLANIWRFPYLCFKSGGGAFLIPYFVMLLVCGIPLLCLELAVGQLTKCGPVQAFAILCPLMKGIGQASIVISFIFCTYYNIIITWVLYYLFNSFSADLPWLSCNETWSSANCVRYVNASNNSTGGEISATQEFFNRVVLGKTDGIYNMGNMRWKTFGLFVLAWILVYLCIFKGIKSSGKVVYVTVTLPYILLIALLAASVTLPGSANGIVYFLKPAWKDILKPEVWVNAACQIFNSIGISHGILLAFSSYNSRKNNIFKDTLIISGINSATSVLAGIVVFSAMGHMSYLLNRPIQEVATQGPELVFIVYPQIFVNLPVPQLWAVLFFIMLVCLGIDSQFALIEVVNTTILDSKYSKVLLKYFKRKEIISLGICIVAFLLGIPNLMEGGIYIFTLLDNYTAVVSLMSIATLEFITLCWLYGGRRMATDISKMTGKSTPLFYKVCWITISPILVGVIFFFTIFKYKPTTYSTYKYPPWADVIGWFVTLASLLCIPVGAISTLLDLQGPFLVRLKQSIKPQTEGLRDCEEHHSDDQNLT